MINNPQIAPKLPHEGDAPNHVAVIMDGNGRWAKARGLPRQLGHREGVEAVRRTVRAAIDQGVGYLTIYSFSSENWNRPKTEVDDLMGLIRLFIRSDLASLHEANVKIVVIGERDGIDPDLMKLIDDSCHTTKDNTGLTLVIAFNYGSRGEIAKAARALAYDAAKGDIDPASITTDAITSRLDTNGIPDPDVLIRTSGELRLSNFLLWQLAYTEFVFLDVLWPDFNADHFSKVIEEYLARERRYGGRPKQRQAVP